MPRWPRSVHDEGRDTGAGRAARGRQDGSVSRFLPGAASPSLERRTAVLEEGMEISDERLDVMWYHIQVLLAQISIMTDWISKKYGVPLIDEESQHFKNIHGDTDEIEEIVASLRHKIPPEIPDLARNKNQETQTEILVPALIANVTDRRVSSSDSDVEVCEEDKSESIENNPAKEASEKQRRKVVIVNTDDSSSDSSSDEVFQQSEDDGMDSDVSDIMIEVIIGKSVTEAEKEKLRRFYSTIEETIPSEGRRCPFEALGRNDGQAVCSSKLPTKVAQKLFLTNDPKASPRSRKRKRRTIKKCPHSGKQLLSVKPNASKQAEQDPSLQTRTKPRRRSRRRPREAWQNPGIVSKKLFNCKYCHMRFSQLWGLWCHVESRHNQRKMFKCSFCKCKFPNKTETYSHVLKVHRKRRLRGSKHKRIDCSKKCGREEEQPPSVTDKDTFCSDRQWPYRKTKT